jgi:hypothetical protein
VIYVHLNIKWCEYCIHMYVNGKMRLVETIPGMGGEEIKEKDVV